MNVWSQRKSTFTLIELLVVVAIISILASLLLPTLAQARARAKTILCASRERQFGMWQEIYRSDNNSWYFVNNTWGGGAVINNIFVDMVQPFMEEKSGTSHSLTVKENFFLCPGSPYTPRPVADAGYIRQTCHISWGWKVCNYMMSCFFGYGNMPLQVKTWWPKHGDPSQPSRLVMMGSIYGTGSSWGYYTSWGWATTYYHPGNSTNLLFADLHVRNYKREMKDLIGTEFEFHQF